MQKTIFVIPDTHVPYQDEAAWQEALRAIRVLEPSGIIIIGDFADFYSVSSHDRDPLRKDSLVDEVATVNQKLDELQHSAGSADIAFIEGNHEDRLRRYLWKKAPELFGVYDIPRLFNLRERGWVHKPYRAGLKVGKVTYKHDLGGKAGKYAAQQCLAEFGGNLVIGHTHRGVITYLGESRPDGDQHFCLNVGWLGDIHKADYTDPAKVRREWQQGFGLVEYSHSGLAYGQFIPIVNGRAAKPL